MKQQNKGKTIKFACAAAVLLAAVGVTAAVGSYFLNVAIVRQETFNEAIEPEDALSGEDEEAINRARAQYDTFRDEVLAKPEITKETVSVTSDDGLYLEADKYTQPGEKMHRWVIFIHGYSSSRRAESSQNIVSVYLNQGYQVLSPDNRAHGASEGKYIGMGWLDRMDILRWISYIAEMDPEAEIFLHGVSMGGAAVMMTAGEILPEQTEGKTETLRETAYRHVKGIVEDSGYSSVWEEFASELRYMYKLPVFPVLYMADAAARVCAGYSFREASAVKQLEKAVVPMLFIHGDRDNFVPFDMVYENFEAYPGADKAILTVSGAGHVESYLREPETYWKTVFSFVEAH